MQKHREESEALHAQVKAAKNDAIVQRTLKDRLARKLDTLQKSYKELEQQLCDLSYPEVSDPTDEDLAHNLHELINDGRGCHDSKGQAAPADADSAPVDAESAPVADESAPAVSPKRQQDPQIGLLASQWSSQRRRLQTLSANAQIARQVQPFHREWNRQWHEWTVLLKQKVGMQPEQIEEWTQFQKSAQETLDRLEATATASAPSVVPPRV